MKTYVLILLIFFSLTNFWFCADHIKSESLTFHIDIDNCKNTIDLKLSDLIDSCRLVPLETTEESLLGDYLRFLYISKNYIIIIDKNGAYKFLPNGKFVKKLINIGRGPNEISGSDRFFYYEPKDLLYIEDDFVQKDQILCYNVRSEVFCPSIKKCFPIRWLAFAIYEDSLIIGSIEGMDSGETNPYGLFFQNFKGEFISGIISHRNFILPRGKGEKILQRLNIYLGDKSVHLKYSFDDTIFSLKNKSLSVYLSPVYRNKATLPKMIPAEGENRVYYLPCENPSYIILDFASINGLTDQGGISRPNYRRSFYLLNKSNGKYGKILSYIDDFIGEKPQNKNPKSIFPSSLPNNKLYVSYTSNEFLKNTSSLNRSFHFNHLNIQMEKIRTNLKETDNPVLLIGMPRSDLQILN
jgi:hypothetical protein